MSEETELSYFWLEQTPYKVKVYQSVVNIKLTPLGTGKEEGKKKGTYLPSIQENGYHLIYMHLTTNGILLVPLKIVG